MDVTIICVPYDTAMRNARMGAGPGRLLGAGLEARLAAAGHTARVEWVEARSTPPAEIRTAFELMRGVAEAVRTARQAGRFPLVLAGNCNSAVGTVAGLGGDVGVCWLDAHGDFNTPETTIGGFLDGMALATLAGRCWRELAAGVPGFRPVDEERVILLSARDLDPLEADALARSRVRHLPTTRDGTLAAALAALAGRGAGAYLHVDLDVLDPSDGRANAFAAPEGLARAELLRTIAAIADRLEVWAAAVTAYDPEADTDGRAGAAALDAIDVIVRAAARCRTT